jgi:hypothetical protein
MAEPEYELRWPSPTGRPVVTHAVKADGPGPSRRDDGLLFDPVGELHHRVETRCKPTQLDLGSMACESFQSIPPAKPGA